MLPGRPSKALSSVEPKSNTRKAAQVIASLAVSAGLLIALVFGMDTAELWSLLSQLRWRWLFLAACLGPLQVWLCAWRWQVASQCLGIPLSLFDAIREFYLSYFLNQLLPGGVAGDAVRVWRQRQSGGLLKALRAALVDRWASMFGLLVTAAAGVGWWVLHGGPTWTLAIVGVSTLVLVGVVVFPGPFSTDVRTCVVDKPTASIMSFTTFAALFTFGLGFLFCGLAVGKPVSLLAMSTLPLVLLSMAIPLSVGGWGLREASAVTLLPLVGWTEEQALMLSAAYGVSVLLGALPGALTPFWSKVNL